MISSLGFPYCVQNQSPVQEVPKAKIVEKINQLLQAVDVVTQTCLQMYITETIQLHANCGLLRQNRFPSPATDYEQGRIDLNKHLISNENASFLFRVRGESMKGIGIYDGDTLIVDRSVTPKHNDIVLAIVDEEFTVKRLYQRNQVVKLIAENSAFAPIVLKEGQELRIWGVVTFNLHKLTNV